MYSIGILTASDKGSQGKRKDVSSETAAAILAGWGKVKYYVVVADEQELISKELIYMADIIKVDIILTTGGTGLSLRDVTPEATTGVIEKLVPGIPEAMRTRCLEKTPRAMLSRGIAGIRGKTLIVNLPGSPKAIQECLEVIRPILSHALAILKGTDGECGQETS